jgi:membrane associated rhomboid family serine protease
VTTSLPPEPPQATEQVPVCPRHPDRVAYVRCQRCERPVCPECQRPAAVGVQCVDCVRQQGKGTRAARTVFGGIASQGRPVVTLTIVGLCVALFLLQYGTSDEVTARLAFYPPLAVAEPYRFLTAAFLHSTGFLLHIAFNLYALWMVGPYLEGLLGRLQFAALYLLSAVGGSVGYYLLVSPYGDNWGTPTVGASGAVFGLFGALFVVNRRLGRQVGGIVAVVAINAVLGFVASGIAWQAHLGGLVTGTVVAALLVYLPRRADVRWASLAGVALVLIAVIVVRSQLLPAYALV